jgi:hypothetical protein
MVTAGSRFVATLAGRSSGQRHAAMRQALLMSYVVGRLVVFEPMAVGDSGLPCRRTLLKA